MSFLDRQLADELAFRSYRSIRGECALSCVQKNAWAASCRRSCVARHSWVVVVVAMGHGRLRAGKDGGGQRENWMGNKENRKQGTKTDD